MANLPQKFNSEVVNTLTSNGIAAGILLNYGLTVLAESLQKIPSLSLFSSLILARLLGILVKNITGVPKFFQPKITFSQKRILRLSIILLGLRLSLPQVFAFGPIGLGIVLATLVSTFIFTCSFGRELGVN
ncbi:Putative membrane protein YeiH [Richelia intracellularis]|nr:Putative membrane protein YeiH [Richelia intracellularis]